VTVEGHKSKNLYKTIKFIPTIEFKLIQQFLLILTFSIGLFALGCGGGGGNGEPIDCKDVGSGGLSCTGNPGACCGFTGFIGMFCRLRSETGTCCQNRFPILCPGVDICVEDLEQCPDVDPVDTELVIFNVFNNCSIVDSPSPTGVNHNVDIYIDGIVSGEVGTNITFDAPAESEFVSVSSSLTRCPSWGGPLLQPEDCTRLEGDQAATYWEFENRTSSFYEIEEFDITIIANGSSFTVTSSCPN